MAFFVPRVGKENQQRVDAAFANAVRKNVYGVVTKHLHVCQPTFGNAVQQFAHARLMHLDTQKIALRIRNRHLEQ